MPYTVRAIHADSKLNCFYGSFADYRDAEVCEREKQGLDHSRENSLVKLFFAQNKTHAARKLKQIRHGMGLK